MTPPKNNLLKHVFQVVLWEHMFHILQNKQYFDCHNNIDEGIIFVGLHFSWWKKP